MYELGAQRCAFRYVVRLVDQLFEHGFVKILHIGVVRNATQMQQADDVIDVVPKDRKPRVFALLNHGHDFFSTVIEVYTDDFVVWHHDIVDGHPFQIEDADEHASVLA